MKLALRFVLSLCTTAACTIRRTPEITPEKIPPVSPAIQARALLLITPSFEEYLSESSFGIHQVFHYGEVAAKALSALVTESFAAAEIRRLPAAEVLPLLSVADTSVADLLLVPSFRSALASFRIDTGGVVETTYVHIENVEQDLALYSPPGFSVMAEVTLHLSAHSLRSGSTFTWVAVGGTGWGMQASWGRLSGFALQEALHALSDSLAAHRSELERVSPPH